MPFANVLIVELGAGTSSDLDGAFSLQVPPGTYTLEISFLGYSTLTISDLQIVEGTPSVINARIQEESEVLEEVVVTAKQIRDTEAAILTIQKKSPNLLDGISSQSFKRVGDSNAAAAIKRVTGVSVEGGKYVFVRGLGDRYTKSILNGMDIPGLDPDRNTLQMDIFPTNLIDNIIVVKSFTPDLPGDFTGGVVDVITKDFPDEKSFNISAGTSYNPDMHLQNDALAIPSRQQDFFGFDDGTRDLPFSPDTKIPAAVASNPDNAILTDLTRSFNPRLAAEEKKSPVNFNFGLSGGNQINKDKVTLGYNYSLNYRNSTDFFRDVSYRSFRKRALNNEEVLELETTKTQDGSLGGNQVLMSGLLGGALKVKNHKFTLNLMRIQNGESRAGVFEQEAFFPNVNVLVRDNLEYSERAISNALLTGKHSFDQGDFEINWKLSPTVSTIKDKDVRATPFRLDDGFYSIEPSEGAEPRRIWRNLEEENYSGKIDFTRKFQMGGRDATFKFGFRGIQKNRDYSILAYRINVRGQGKIGLTGDPNQLLHPDNTWTIFSDVGTFVVGNVEPANTYQASQNILAAYAMNTMDISDKLKAIYGLRVERFVHKYTGQNNLGDQVFDNEEFINSTDFLPSLNFVYALSGATNLRASYSRTLARPSFKEASIAQIYDALSDRTFIGNKDLQQTNINNYDLRIESFQGGGQMLAVSGFYKAFTNPIEIVAFSQATPDNFQPRNVGNARVFGLELELRKNLSSLGNALRNFNIGSNVTLVKSEVEMDLSTGGEYESRLENARPGEEIKTTRELQGQSPYIINAYINYVNPNNGLEANISYNVQGKRLSIVGIGRNPDVFEQPFHGLNFKASKTIGENRDFKLSVNVTNILNSKRQRDYESFGAENQIFEIFAPARSYGISLGYSL